MNSASSPAKNSNKAIVIIAARNEADNIAEVVNRAGQYGRVIVVDNASSDGTAGIAEQVGAVVLRHARDTHIRRSYVDGFGLALVEGADRVVQLDAGLSFDAGDIPKLLRGLEHADLVIGSRFMPGARCRQPRLRHALSRGGSWLVRLATGMPHSDLTSGFKAYRASLLKELDDAGVLAALRAKAHAFQFELTYEIYCRGYAIHEVPVSYISSRSSVDLAVVAEAMQTVCRLALR